MTWALGIDFGTSRSAGAMFADGTVTALEVEGNRWMASAVGLDLDGTIVVGSAAEHLAGVHPDRLDRTPKLHVGSPAPLVLGGTPVAVRDAVAAVLAVFLAEGKLRRGGAEPDACVLTHPVRWGDPRKEALRDAAVAAGLPVPWLSEEPVAAAVHYAADQVSVGDHVGVYDLGGGTFDTAILRRSEDGFEVVGTPGGDETIGGEHFDHALYRYFGACLAEDDPDLWEQMNTGDERKWKQAAVDLLVQSRRAKEALSSYTSTQVFVPLADRELVVNRSQFEAMIVDDVERSVDMMDDTVASAGMKPDDLAAIYLVGGSSRIPLVVQLLEGRFGDRVTTRDEPKSVVALGAAQVAGHALPAGEARGEAESHDEAPEIHFDASAAQAAPLLWRAQLPRPPGLVGSDAGSVFVGSEDGTLSAFDLTSGARRWAVGLATFVWPAPVSDGTVVVAAGADGVVVALDAASGGLYWRAATGAAVATSPILTPDSVLVANDAGVIASFDRASGMVRWQLPVGVAVRSLVATGGHLLVAGCADGRVFGVDVATGTASWLYQTGGPVAAPATPAGDVVLVPSGDAILYALDPADGRPVWAYRTGGPLSSPVAVADDKAYVGSADGYLYAIDASEGDPLWQARLGSGYTSGPAVRGGSVFVDTGDGETQALDLAGVSVRWRVGTGAYNRCRPVIVAGVVIVATTFGQVYALIDRSV
ncbi:MAG: Hsp70 family protein [Acidimicrobiia bacterium]|nr:Hsp70 family protein [Acidimicrobiia bacterium]